MWRLDTYVFINHNSFATFQNSDISLDKGRCIWHIGPRKSQLII